MVFLPSSWSCFMQKVIVIRFQVIIWMPVVISLRNIYLFAWFWCKSQVVFHGISINKEDIILDGSEAPIRIDAEALLSLENLSPAAVLNKVRVAATFNILIHSYCHHCIFTFLLVSLVCYSFISKCWKINICRWEFHIALLMRNWTHFQQSGTDCPQANRHWLLY